MTQKSTSTRLLSTNGTGSVQRSAVSGGSGETISCGLNCFRRIFALFILVAFISIIVFSLNRYAVVAVVGKSHELIWPLFHYPGALSQSSSIQKLISLFAMIGLVVWTFRV